MWDTKILLSSTQRNPRLLISLSWKCSFPQSCLTAGSDFSWCKPPYAHFELGSSRTQPFQLLIDLHVASWLSPWHFTSRGIVFSTFQKHT